MGTSLEDFLFYSRISRSGRGSLEIEAAAVYDENPIPKEIVVMPENKSQDSNGAPDGKTFLPPLDFSSIIAPFYTQALIKLGLLNDPALDAPEENLPLARRLIDLLDLLRDRTQGRLEPVEEKFLESVLAQLKMHYVEKAEVIKL